MGIAIKGNKLFWRFSWQASGQYVQFPTHLAGSKLEVASFPLIFGMLLLSLRFDFWVIYQYLFLLILILHRLLAFPLRWLHLTLLPSLTSWIPPFVSSLWEPPIWVFWLHNLEYWPFHQSLFAFIQASFSCGMQITTFSGWVSVHHLVRFLWSFYHRRNPCSCGIGREDSHA